MSEFVNSEIQNPDSVTISRTKLKINKSIFPHQMQTIIVSDSFAYATMMDEDKYLLFLCTYCLIKVSDS